MSRPRSIAARLAFAFLIPLFLFAGLAPPESAAQGRKWKRNAEGFQEWAPWKKEACKRCNGKGLAPCRTCEGGRKELAAKCGDCRGKKESACQDCFGAGHYPDSLRVFPCYRCDARGFVVCRLCGGTLRALTKGDGEGLKCKVCRKKGGFKCSLCNGRRYLEYQLPRGRTFESLDESELRALRSRWQPLVDRTSRFVDDEDKRWFDRKYEEVSAEILEVWPGFKPEVKLLERINKGCAKHKEFRVDELLGHNRAVSLAAARNVFNDHVYRVADCLKLIEENKKIADRKRSGGGN